MADETTDRYRRAAEAAWTAWDAAHQGRMRVVSTETAEAERIRSIAEWADEPWLRAAVDANRPADVAAGREAAAQAIEGALAAREAQGCTYVRITDVRQAIGGDR